MPSPGPIPTSPRGRPLRPSPGPLPVGLAGPFPRTPKGASEELRLSAPSLLGWQVFLQALYAPDPLLSPSCCWRRVYTRSCKEVPLASVIERSTGSQPPRAGGRRSISSSTPRTLSAPASIQTPLLKQGKQLCFYNNSSR